MAISELAEAVDFQLCEGAQLTPHRLNPGSKPRHDIGMGYMVTDMAYGQVTVTYVIDESRAASETALISRQRFYDSAQRLLSSRYTVQLVNDVKIPYLVVTDN